jgi:hypothetical protein
VLNSEKTGNPLTNSRHWFKGALEKAKIKDFVRHDLQHCFATMLRMKGAKLEDIGERPGTSLRPWRNVIGISTRINCMWCRPCWMRVALWCTGNGS